MCDQVVKDHQKIMLIMKKRNEQLQKLLKKFEQDDLDPFINALCSERDMFVVNDLIEFLVLQVDPDDESKFLDLIDLKQVNRLVVKLK